MRSIRVVVPPPFLLSATAIWIYLTLAAVLGIGFLIGYQNRLRSRRRQKGAEAADFDESVQDNEAQQTTAEKPTEPEEEVTDEYEIIEE